MIVATAGHVDHGKTELVRALTGVDTDRLPEEKSRGLTIDLGFAYQGLDSGAILGFVDVPGHRRFIRNMLAGVGGIDMGLLVVAADDGIMPQTREHAAILDLLGIDRCVVALTKIDTVAAERVVEVSEDVGELLATTAMAGAPVYPVCAPRGEGIEALASELASRAESARAERGAGGFRLAVDRCFTVQGAGTVVTGMVFSGQAETGANLVVSPSGLRVRVRGIRAHDRTASQASAGERCALNIAGRGVGEDSVGRGHWVVEESLHVPAERIDVKLKVLASEERSLKHWTPVHLHLGASHAAARIAVLGGGSIEPGSEGLAQLVVDGEVATLWGDRFVVRDQSARRTIGGGRVIDPRAPKRGRARPERLAWLEAMALEDPAQALAGMARTSAAGVEIESFGTTRNLGENALESALGSSALIRVGAGTHARGVDPERWEALSKEVLDAVRGYHRAEPEVLGPNLRHVHLALETRIPEPMVESIVERLSSAGALVRKGPLVHAPEHRVALSDADVVLWDRVAPLMSIRDGTPPSLQQAAERVQLDKSQLEGFLKRAIRAGLAVRIARNRYLSVEAADTLAARAAEVAAGAEDGRFTAAQFRDAAGVGRNFIIDLLGWFDRMGITERFGDVRRMKRR